MATASRRAAASRVSRSKPVKGQPSAAADHLADQLASRLTISDSKAKKVVSPEEARIEAMKAVNDASQTLSNCIQSGWKGSANNVSRRDATTSTVLNAAASAEKHLSILRECKPKDIDVERAAVSLLGKIVVLEVYDATTQIRRDIHAALSSILGEPSSELLSIPLPSDLSTIDTVLLTQIFTYLVHAISIAAQLDIPQSPTNSITARKYSYSIDSFSDILSTSPGTLQSWLLSTRSHTSFSTKYTDSLLMRMYNQLIKSPGLSQASPRAMFQLRIYALTCLAYTSPGNIEPDSFWNQAIRSAGLYVKAAASTAPSTTSSISSPHKATELIIRGYYDVIKHTESRSDCLDFRSGKGWVTFCEHWLAFAKKIGDIKTIHRIVHLMNTKGIKQGPSSGSVPQADLTPRVDDDRSVNPIQASKSGKALYLEGAQLCATLAQITALMEQESTSGEKNIKGQVNEALEQISSSPAIALLPAKFLDDDGTRVRGKVERALERLRRVSIRVLENSTSHPSVPDDFKDSARSLLAVVVSILKVPLQTLRHDDFLARSIDALFVLSKSCLNPHDPRTYATSYDYLKEASEILDALPDLSTSNEENKIELIDVANYWRCISGAWHNLAGMLYQADRHGAAIGFLKEGCELGVKAFELLDELLGPKVSDSQGATDLKVIEGWKQLEGGLYRRWELLAVCHNKIGDRKGTFAAFVNSVSCFPFKKAHFEQYASTSPLDELFNSSSYAKQLAVMIDRLTYTGALDLFFSSTELSLLTTSSKLPSHLAGALVERQITSLDGSRWKESARIVISGLLTDTLRAYPKDVAPVRRARVLLRCLEFLYHCNPDVAQKLPPVKLMTDEIERLLVSSDLKHDAGLSRYCILYRASAYFWLALHGHRRPEPTEIVMIEQDIDKGCELLERLLSDNASVAAKDTPTMNAPNSQTSTKGSSSAKRGTKVAVRRQKSVKKAPSAQDPVTPVQRTRPGIKQATSDGIATPPKADSGASNMAIGIEEFDKLSNLLQLTSRISGLLGLILTKVKVLDLQRKFCESYKGQLNEGFILSSVELAQEYVKLGKTRRATKIFSQLWELIRSGQLPDEIVAYFYLRFSEALAVAEEGQQGSIMYREALALSGRVDLEDKAAPTAQRIHARVAKLERAAIAAQVFSALQVSKEDMSTSIEVRLQALRLWNRAADTLARLNAPPPTSTNATEDNPFLTPPSTETNNTVVASPRNEKQFPRRTNMNSLEWRISEGMLGVLLSLSYAYSTRGSVREAEYFAQQAQDLAESINAPIMVSRALARKSELQVYQGKLEQSQKNISKAQDLLSAMPGLDTAEIHRLWARYHQKLVQHEDAEQLYGETRIMLAELDDEFMQFDEFAFGPRKSIDVQPPETVVPEKLASILREHITLLSLYGNDYNALLESLLALPDSSSTKAEEQAALAQLGLQDVYTRFRGDMFLSSITESAMALPMGMSSKNGLAIRLPTQDILATLEETERVSWSNLALISKKGDVPMVRSTAVSLALIKAFQTSLGKSATGMSTLVTNLLDASTAVTLRRELLEAIEHKFPNARMKDDLDWPIIDEERDVVHPHRRQPRPQHSGLSSPIGFSDGDGSPMDGVEPMKKYWQSLQKKYSSRILGPNALSEAAIGLPSNWTVVHINLTDDKNTLFISRQQGGDAAPEPLIFCVPLKGRRDAGDDEEHLTFDDAVAEFDDIIHLSDVGTQAAAKVKNGDQEARANWWRDRARLDQRLRELLENIEFCWLGGFKTILSHRQELPQDSLSDLRGQLEKVFHRSLRLQDKQPKGSKAGHRRTASQAQASLSQVTFDDTLVECFSVLSPKCKDEELEDLAFFVLDLFQLHGVPIAIAEVDVMQLVVDLRAVLEDHMAKVNKRKKQRTKPGPGQGLASTASGGQNNGAEAEHIFLILDKNVQGFPWESIPTLRGRSVSRIPSVDFLVDRIDYAKALGKWMETQSPHNDQEIVDGGMSTDGRKGYFILNPSGDLVRTQERFQEWSDGMRKLGWDGIVGKPPSEQQMLEVLRRNELVVYFGHGGAEQYVRTHKIRHLPQCAATMLWGCSSGILREAGDFDRTGTPYSYILAGCPALVANLWDVTDRDIDKFSLSVFDHLHLTPDALRNSLPPKTILKGKGVNAPAEHSSNWTSLTTAVAKSREVCKLKYLTGAAPIVYGIPFYLV